MSGEDAAPGADLPWRRPIAVADVPETGQHIEMSADEATRAEIARLAGFRSLPRLAASFDVSRHGREGLHVTGTVSALVGQTCVVTLEPLDNEVEELVDLTFVPAQDIVKVADGEDAGVEPEGPEPITGGAVDLGKLATEFLLVGVDPYPRKPGAVFEPPAAPDDPSTHPFAALAALKNRSQPDEK